MLQPITSYSWAFTDSQRSVVWDTLDNIQVIREKVSLLLQGCKCATGCTTGRCGCRKNNRQCSEGYQCKNCTNLLSRTKEATELADIALEEQVTWIQSKTLRS